MKADEISSLCYFQFVGAGSLAYAYKLCTLYITITDVYQYFEHVSYLCLIPKKKLDADRCFQLRFLESG